MTTSSSPAKNDNKDNNNINAIRGYTNIISILTIILVFSIVQICYSSGSLQAILSANIASVTNNFNCVHDDKNDHDDSLLSSISCLTDGCYHVFLDVGSNRGVHGRFVFEPEKYRQSHFATHTFGKFFGPGNRKQQNICVVAMEPNPRHAKVQTATATAYGWMGWRYHYLPVAVSDQPGTMTFYHNSDPEHEDWGFGIKSLKEESVRIDVETIDFANFLRDHVFNRQIPEAVPENNGLPPRVAIKMDIEGSEYQVLKRLIQAAALPRDGLDLSKINYMVGEAHPRFAPMTVQNVTYPTRESLVQLMSQLIEEIQKLGGPTFQILDDESYLHDGMEYPQPVVV